MHCNNHKYYGLAMGMSLDNMHPTDIFGVQGS